MSSEAHETEICLECEGTGKISARNCSACGGKGEIIIHSHPHEHEGKTHDHPHPHSGPHHPSEKVNHSHTHEQ